MPSESTSMSVPPFVSAELWTNDDRMFGLMSMFKRRDVNPQDWDKKMKFWMQAIHDCCAHGRQPICTQQQLCTQFQRGDRIPAGMNTVVQHMISEHKLIPYDEYMHDAGGWLWWGLDTFVKSPLFWLTGWKDNATAAAAANHAQTQNTLKLVCVDVVEDQARQLLERHDCAQSDDDILAHSVIDWKQLRQATRDIFADDDALSLSLVHLQREHVLTVAMGPNGEKIIKFRETHNAPGPVQVTDIDKNILNMRNAIVKLDAEITQLENKQKSLESDARRYVKAGQKTRAMQVLRQKKVIENKIKEKDAVYTNLENLLHKVTSTDDQNRVLAAYKSGVAAFKNNLTKYGLTPDQVDETMDDIHEAMSDYEDITAAMSPTSTSFGIDSHEVDELEKELGELIGNEHKEGVAVKKPRIELPSVPTEQPASSKLPVKLDRLKELRRQLEEA